MKLYELFIDEYSTKSGDEITFKIKEDIEGDNNRGWIVHEIDAYVKGQYAGYLKIAYIPKERFKRWYPSIFNYISQVKGNSILPFNKKSKHYSTFTDEELMNTYKHISWVMFHKDLSMEKIDLSRNELLSRIQDYEKKLTKQYKKEFKEFIEQFVDNPYVDFIRVFEKDDYWPGSKVGQSTKYDFQRQRIGTALYLTGAEFLKKKGLMLRAATGQSKSAKATWDALDKEGFVLHKGDSRYIDPSKV